MNTEPTDWQWIGPHTSQRMFGITEKRAKAYAERHGGEAKKMGGDGKGLIDSAADSARAMRKARMGMLRPGPQFR